MAVCTNLQLLIGRAFPYILLPGLFRWSLMSSLPIDKLVCCQRLVWSLGYQATIYSKALMFL